MTDTDPSDLTRDALEREVAKLRDKVRSLKDENDRVEQEIADVQSNASADIYAAREPVDQLTEALAALHEQAHGPTSVRFCQVEPCRSIESNYAGPAPLALVMI